MILAAVMAGVTVLACIVNFLSVKIASRISTDFSAALRGQVFEKVQSFSAAELDKFGTASLVTRSTSDITNVQNFLIFLRCYESSAGELRHKSGRKFLQRTSYFTSYFGK